MKKNYLWSLLAIMMATVLSVGFTSCGEDEESVVSVNPTSVSFEAEGGLQQIMVASNTSWTVSGFPNWIQPSITSGKNNQQLMLTATNNPDEGTRTAYITISTVDGEASVILNVTQQGKKVDIYEVAGTTWEDNHYYSDGSTYVASLIFEPKGSNRVKYQLTYTSGTSSTGSFIEYTYTRTNNIVVMTPIEAGYAVMEGNIDASGAKIILTNTSSGEQTDVLYKKQ